MHVSYYSFTGPPRHPRSCKCMHAWVFKHPLTDRASPSSSSMAISLRHARRLWSSFDKRLREEDMATPDYFWIAFTAKHITAPETWSGYSYLDDYVIQYCVFEKRPIRLWANTWMELASYALQNIKATYSNEYQDTLTFLYYFNKSFLQTV